MSTPPGTPFPYDDYEEYFNTPDVGNIDDALNAPAVDPVSYGATNDANATAEWTYSEEEIFQNSLAEHGFSHPQLFEVISARLPGKTAGQVKEHFDALVQAGCIQIPDNSVPRANTSEGTSQGRQKWTEEEHNLFLRGLAQCGKGGWRIISRDFVKTKTPSQVASHAQKYYMRMNSFTPPMRRRYSLNDTRIVNSEIVQYPTRGPLIRSKIMRSLGS